MEEILAQIRVLASQISFDNAPLEECQKALQEHGPEAAFQSAVFSIEQNFPPLGVSCIFQNLNSFLSPSSTLLHQVVDTFAPVFLNSPQTISIWISKSLAISIFHLEMMGEHVLSQFFDSIENQQYAFSFLTDFYRQLSLLSSSTLSLNVKFYFFTEFVPSHLSMLLSIFLSNADTNSLEFLLDIITKSSPSPMYILCKNVGNEEAAEAFRDAIHPKITEAIVGFYAFLTANYSLASFQTLEQRNHIIELITKTISLISQTNKEQVLQLIEHIIEVDMSDPTFYVANNLSIMLAKCARNDIISDAFSTYFGSAAEYSLSTSNISLLDTVLSSVSSIARTKGGGENTQFVLTIIEFFLQNEISISNDQYFELLDCAINLQIIAHDDSATVVAKINEIVSQNGQNLNAIHFSFFISIINEYLEAFRDQTYSESDDQQIPEELLSFAQSMAQIDEVTISDISSFVLIQVLMRLVLFLYDIYKNAGDESILESLQTIAESRISSLLAYLNEGNGNELEFSNDMINDSYDLVCSLVRAFKIDLTDDFIVESINFETLSNLGEKQQINTLVEAVSSIDASIQMKILSFLIQGMIQPIPISEAASLNDAITEIISSALSSQNFAEAIRITAKFPDLSLQSITACAEALESFSGKLVKACAEVGLSKYWGKNTESQQKRSQFVEILCSKISFEHLNPVPRLRLAKMLGEFLSSGGTPHETTVELIMFWVNSIIQRDANTASTCDYRETESQILRAFTDLPTEIILSNPPEFFQAFLQFILLDSSEDFLKASRVFVTLVSNADEGIGMLQAFLSELLASIPNAEALIQSVCESYDEEGSFNNNEQRMLLALTDISKIFHYFNRFNI